LTDIRRGFEFPEKSSPLAGSSFRRGLGAGGLFGFPEKLTILSQGRGPPRMAFSPFKFLQEVRSETSKVTWPSRRETTITTIMVFVMVALASVFFFASDQAIRYLVTLVLGIH
jgi:preprotein translocase subunit SecE